MFGVRHGLAGEVGFQSQYFSRDTYEQKALQYSTRQNNVNVVLT